MHDGQNLFDDSTSYTGEWSVDESLNDLFKKTVKGFIVVGINHGDSLRIEELTPWKNEQYGGGKGAEYAKFVVETLKPFY
jgi:predicted alpha/beta superfamily hydrolase